METKRVVVTGMGLASSLGHTLDDYWQNLLEAKSGISDITLFDTTEFKTKIAGEIKDLDIHDYLDKKEARRMDRFTHFALISSQKCMEDAHIDLDNTDLDRFGVIYASGIGGMDTYEAEHNKYIQGGPRRVSPFFIPMLIADISAGHISMKYGLKGPNYCTTSACASASHAIGDAFFQIKLGKADIILAGGSESGITPMGVAGFNSAQALSTNNENPQTASRPFDKDRDGFVMGEGGAALILEEYEHAKARGAKIYGEIVGAGFTGDAYHITAPVPDGNGATRAMKSAMDEGGIKPEEVDYVNAHGTSTYFNDKIETLAIKNALGEHAYTTNVSSTKSMIGHLLGASGAFESIACMMTLKTQKIHPTANYTTPDPECDLNYTPNKPVDKNVRYVLSNSFGFGGHNVSLAFKKYEE